MMSLQECRVECIADPGSLCTSNHGHTYLQRRRDKWTLFGTQPAVSYASPWVWMAIGPENKAFRSISD